MTSHVFVRNLPRNIQDSELEELFLKYGKIKNIEVNKSVGSASAFIDFKHYRDAKHAIRGRDKYYFDGYPLRVAFSYRVFLSNLPLEYEWQDLKKGMSKAGNVVYADVRRNGDGVVDFSRRNDAEYVIKSMNNAALRFCFSTTSIRVAASKNYNSQQKAARTGDVEFRNSGQKRGLSPAFNNHSSKRRQKAESARAFSSVQQSSEVTDPQESASLGSQTILDTNNSSTGTEVVFTLSVQNCGNIERGANECTENLLVDMTQTLSEAVKHITRGVNLVTSSAGDTRVAPLIFTRLGHGGKTTFLWCLFKTLKANGFSPIHISFKGGFQRGPQESQLSALLRLLGAEFVNPSTVVTQYPACSAHTVIGHIDCTCGDSKVVLLIDDLDVLAEGPMDADTTSFLKKEFLDKTGRYLVFTSRIPLHVDETKADELSEFIQYRTASPRGLISVHQPHSVDLTELRMMPGCAALTSAEVTIYGGIPSLIYSFKGRDRNTPRERFQLQDIQLPKKHQDRLLGEFIYEVLEGTRLHEHNHWSYAFASTPKYGIVWWPLCYIAGILQLFQRKIAHIPFDALVKRHLAASCTSPVTSDVDWELLVQAALMLRCIDAMVNYSRGPFGIAEIGVKPDVECHSMVGECTTLQQAQTEIMGRLNNATRATIMLFKPSCESFPDYDGFIGYRAKDGSTRVFAHLVKLCRTYPDRDAPVNSWIERSLHVRGIAPEETNRHKGWEYLDRKAILELLGASLRPLYPTSWPEPPVPTANSLA